MYDPLWLALDQLAALLAGSLPSLCLRVTPAQFLITWLSTTFNTVSNPNLLVCLILLIAVLVTVQDVDESIYLAIQIIGGHILLPLLVITILLKKTVNRHPVFVNFCVSWIVSSVVYSMLCVCLRFLFFSQHNSSSTECTRGAVQLLISPSIQVLLPALFKLHL